MRWIAPLILLLASLPAMAQERAAVLISGPAEPAARLHDALSSGLNDRGLSVLTNDEVANLLYPNARKPSVPAAAALVKRIDRLLARARKDYYADRLTQAMSALDEGLGLVDTRGQDIPVRSHVRVRLWRAAVLLAYKDDVRAGREVSAALALNRELEVDTETFRPSMVELVASVRASKARLVNVKLSRVPAGATVYVDDRPSAATFTVVAGYHRIAILAAARTPLLWWMNLEADRAITIPPLAPRMSASLTRNIDQVVSTQANGESFLPTLAGALGVDTLVLARVGDDSMRAAEWRAKEKIERSKRLRVNAAALREMQTWARGQRKSVSPPVQPSTTRLAIEAGPTFGARLRAYEGTNTTTSQQQGFSNQWSGGGARVQAALRLSRMAAHVRFHFVDYFTTQSTTLPDGVTSATVSGGQNSFADVRAGIAIGPVVPFLGFGYEAHTADDILDVGGQPLNVYPSYTRLHTDVGTWAAFPLGRRTLLGNTTVGGAAALSVFNRIEESALSSGTDPQSLPAVNWNVYLQSDAKRWGLRLAYDGQFRQTNYSGTSALALEDSTVRESFHTVVLWFRWRTL